jgi:hypothetical protein
LIFRPGRRSSPGRWRGVQDGVEDAAGLAGRHHVHVEIGEHLRVPRIASASVWPAWMSFRTAVMIAELLVLRLLGQDREALHQRQARVDHGRELPGEDHDLAGLHPRAEGDVDLLRLGLDRDRDQPLAPQVGDDLVRLGRSISPVCELARRRPLRAASSVKADVAARSV